jgi:hypothetical protein
MGVVGVAALIANGGVLFVLCSSQPKIGVSMAAETIELPLYLAIVGREAVGKPIGGREPATPQGE